MAATQKLYPRGTVKRIVKAHSNRNVSKNADILVSPSVQCACQQDLVANGSLLLGLPDIPRLHAIHARVRFELDYSPPFLANCLRPHMSNRSLAALDESQANNRRLD